MIAFFFKRLLMLLPVFLAVSGVIFLIIHLIPGDPVDNLLRPGSSAEQKAALVAKYGLDRPLPVQYLNWLAGLLRGDLGESIVQHQPVARLIMVNMPYSLTVGGVALVISALTGITTGVLAASYQHRFADHAAMLLVLLGSTIPSFWLGLLLMLVFSVHFGWFPVSGARHWSSVVLPVATIAFGATASVARVTRVAMLDAGRMDFILLLHAKGLSHLHILTRHTLRHALMPVITLLSLRIGWILGGAVTVEYVFARPGLGGLLIKALGQRDYPLVQGCLLMLAMAVMIGTLIGDVTQAALDPRVREGSQ